MHYTTRHWVAQPGHEDRLIAGLHRLTAVAAPFLVANYIGRELTRPGYIVTFAVWANRATYDAFNEHPDTRQVLEEAIRPHLDPDAGGPIIHMEPIA